LIIGLQQLTRSCILTILSILVTCDTLTHLEQLFSLPRLEFEDFEKFLHNLAEQKKVFMSELAWKLVSCGIPDPVKMNVLNKFKKVKIFHFKCTVLESYIC
jgi:hypothetical protein